MAENKDVAIILNKYDELLNKNLISEAGEYLEKEIEIAKSENDSFAEMTLHNEVVSFHRRTGEGLSQCHHECTSCANPVFLWCWFLWTSCS